MRRTNQEGTMAMFTLGDIKLTLQQLDQRRALLEKSTVGTVYLPLLDQRRREIEALPPAVVEAGAPHADALRDTDLKHDALGEAIYFLGRALEEHPATPPEVRAAARGTRLWMVPRRAVLRRSYADEAAAALDHRRELAGMEAQLRLVPVPGGTLYDWAQEYIATGEALHELLTKRADAAPTIDQKTRLAAGHLRSSTLGLLNRMRQALTDELAANPNLPRDLEAQLFGYMDELAGMRAR
jgi:hypothetical protein